MSLRSVNYKPVTWKVKRYSGCHFCEDWNPVE